MKKLLLTISLIALGAGIGTIAISQDFIGLITTDRLLGRDTAGTGQVEELTVGGGLEFSGSGGIQRSALTGDVTSAAGSGATNIDADKVGIDELDLIDGDTPTNGDCLTYDTGAGGTVEAITCPGVGGGDSVSVNGAAMTDPDFDDAAPAAVSGANVLWQYSAPNLSAYTPAASATVIGVAELATTTETLTGTDAVRAVTPDALAALWEAGADIADGATITVGEGGYFNLITSTTAITAFTITTDKAGRPFRVRFNTIRTLTHNATSLILPGGASITTAVGDIAFVRSLGSGNVVVEHYSKASGAAVTGGAPTPNVQTMTATGSGDSWDKPTGGQSMCRVELWGAGGSGGKGAAAGSQSGGGGGAYVTKNFVMSGLGATETVSIATGGIAQTTASTAGNVGGNTTFGSGATLVTAFGGGGGGHLAGGGTGGAGGGTAIAAGSSATSVSGGEAGGQPVIGTNTVGLPGHGGRGAVAAPGFTGGAGWNGNGAGGGGGTGDATSVNGNGGAADWGGGGGGAGAEDSAPGAGAGGASTYGGAGGAGAFDANNATAGTQPGGGGGGSETGDSGAGGNGKAIITCW